MDKRTDRMPKEFKLTIYIITVGLTYFLLYSVDFYTKFREKTFFLYAVAFAITYIFLLVFLALKKNWARIGLVVLSYVQIIFATALLIALIFFKQSTAFLARVMHTGVFTFYLILGQFNTTPERGTIALAIIITWTAVIIKFLINRETKRYIITKNYELQNTQKQAIIILTLFFISLGVILFLVKF